MRRAAAPGLAAWLTTLTRFAGGGVLLLAATTADAQPDPLLGQQWHLKSRVEEPAGANVEAAWLITRGAGIAIGIVDGGLQHTHPDISPNYAPALSHDFDFGDADPAPSAGIFHGTAVGGVAGARGANGIGVSGAAPSATLAGLRLTAGPASDADMAAALGHLPDAIHILSNSWGPPDTGAALDRPGPLTEAAIANAVTTGRGGRGRIFTWAAGNGQINADNCNFDGFANSRYVIAAGALTDEGQQAAYSEECSAVFIAAPSSGGTRGVTTTDLVGDDGSAPGDYTSSFGGTSATAPLVSGAVALMLAANPLLGWRDVKYILAATAVPVNPGDPGWSSGPFPHHEKYGFGLLDAGAAVALAPTWTNVGAEVLMVDHTAQVDLPIPDNSATGAEDSVTISTDLAGATVEHVEVVIDATHPFRGDLEVTLTAPDGTSSRLATVRPGDSGDNFTAWRFGSVRHWGASAIGTWRVRVADRAPLDVGTWNRWTLRIYGGRVPPSPAATIPPGDLDFGFVAAGSTARQTLTVTNDGLTMLRGTVTTEPPFSITSGATLEIPSLQTQGVEVSFSPPTVGTFAGTVTFRSGVNAAFLSVRGVGVGPPTISVSPSSATFGNLTVGSAADTTFTVTNDGDVLLGTVTTSAPFSVVSGAALNVGPNGAQSVTVRFSPVTPGSFTGTVSFVSNAGTVLRTVSGTAVVSTTPTPAPTLATFVSSFYVDVLGRPADTAGIVAWEQFLRLHCDASGFDAIARGFLDSDEFRTLRPLSLVQLVTLLYRTFLGRDPDAGGLAGWATVFRDVRLAVALRGFIVSREFQGLLPDRANRVAVEAVIRRFYIDILGRLPEPAELAAWVEYVSRTGDLESVAVGFLTAPEFEARPMTFQNYVTILYRASLGREPDRPGLDAWEGVLRTALLTVVNVGFVPSTEFQGKRTTLCN